MTLGEIDVSTRQRILDANDMLDAIDEADEDARIEAEKDRPKR